MIDITPEMVTEALKILEINEAEHSVNNVEGALSAAIEASDEIRELREQNNSFFQNSASISETNRVLIERCRELKEQRDELLEALKRVLPSPPEPREFDNDVYENGDGISIFMTMNDIKCARAAIAKAEGGSNE